MQSKKNGDAELLTSNMERVPPKFDHKQILVAWSNFLMQKHSQLTCELTIMASCTIKVKKKRIYDSKSPASYVYNNQFLQNSCIMISKSLAS